MNTAWVCLLGRIDVDISKMLLAEANPWLSDSDGNNPHVRVDQPDNPRDLSLSFHI